MKCANGVDGVSAEEDGANVCTPNEIASETKRPSFKADSRSQLSDMQMRGRTMEVFKHTKQQQNSNKIKHFADSVKALLQRQHSTNNAVTVGGQCYHMQVEQINRLFLVFTSHPLMH